MKAWFLFGAAGLAVLAADGTALAWGSSGHRMIGRAAIETLPPELPPFLREQRCQKDEADEYSLRHELPQKNFRTPMKNVRRGPNCGAATPMPCWARMR